VDDDGWMDARVDRVCRELRARHREADRSARALWRALLAKRERTIERFRRMFALLGA